MFFISLCRFIDFEADHVLWKFLSLSLIFTWEYLGVPGSTWDYLEVLLLFCVFECRVPGSTWENLGVLGSTWDYLGVP